jgi:hypothetical protein
MKQYKVLVKEAELENTFSEVTSTYIYAESIASATDRVEKAINGAIEKKDYITDTEFVERYKKVEEILENIRKYYGAKDYGNPDNMYYIKCKTGFGEEHVYIPIPYNYLQNTVVDQCEAWIKLLKEEYNVIYDREKLNG